MEHFKFIDHSQGWPGTLMFSVLSASIKDADEAFKQAVGKHPSQMPHVGLHLVPITIGSILMASGLFDSKSDCIRSIKGKSVKVNRVPVESFDEPLEQGDFLNFFWLPGATSLIQQHGKGLLSIHKGKAATLIQITPQGIEVLV